MQVSKTQKIPKCMSGIPMGVTSFTYFFSLPIRPMRPVGCSLVSRYKRARIKGVTTVSPVLVQSSFETIQRWSRYHVVWQIIPQGCYTEGEEWQSSMWTTLSFHQLVVLTSQGSLRSFRQKFRGSHWIHSTEILENFDHITRVTTTQSGGTNSLGSLRLSLSAPIPALLFHVRSKTCYSNVISTHVHL